MLKSFICGILATVLATSLYLNYQFYTGRIAPAEYVQAYQDQSEGDAIVLAAEGRLPATGRHAK